MAAAQQQQPCDGLVARFQREPKLVERANKLYGYLSTLFDNLQKRFKRETTFQTAYACIVAYRQELTSGSVPANVVIATVGLAALLADLLPREINIDDGTTDMGVFNALCEACGKCGGTITVNTCTGLWSNLQAHEQRSLRQQFVRVRNNASNMLALVTHEQRRAAQEAFVTQTAAEQQQQQQYAGRASKSTAGAAAGGAALQDNAGAATGTEDSLINALLDFVFARPELKGLVGEGEDSKANCDRVKAFVSGTVGDQLTNMMKDAATEGGRGPDPAQLTKLFGSMFSGGMSEAAGENIEQMMSDAAAGGGRVPDPDQLSKLFESMCPGSGSPERLAQMVPSSPPSSSSSSSPPSG